MAGNTLNRALFKRGPDGEMRQALYKGGLGGIGNFFKYGFSAFKKDPQFEMFKYKDNPPINYVDDLGENQVLNTQEVIPRDVNNQQNIFGQNLDDSFYNIDSQMKDMRNKNRPPIFEQTEEVTQTDLFGNTTTTGGGTKFNAANIYNAPFTNFGTLKERWATMDPATKKKAMRNIIATGTIYTMMPDWLKDDPVANEVIMEQESANVNTTLEEQGLPVPAMSYEDAVDNGEQVRKQVEEFVMMSDQEISDKEKSLQEEQAILNSSSTSSVTNSDNADDLNTNKGESNLAEGVEEEAANLGYGANNGEQVRQGVETYDLTGAIAAEDSDIEIKSIENTKAELMSLMGDDSKMMNTMMLMQLGLSLMSGKTNRSGLAGFLDVAATAGNEILPIAMQNLANKSKQEKEIALAAYEIYRDEVTAKNARITDIEDFYTKELIKKQFEGNDPKGTLRQVMMKKVIETPDGQTYTQWDPLDQVFDKGERAAYYLNLSRNGDPERGIEPGDIRITSDLDNAAASAGNDPYQGDLTKSQRGQHLALASVFEAALPDALNIQMNPKFGLYSGNLETGATASVASKIRTLTRESKQFVNAFGLGNVVPWVDNTGKASLATLDVQMKNNMIFSGSQANQISETGSKDVYKGEAMGPDGVLTTDVWATDAYVKNLISNPALDVLDQINNRLGFLAARLKQPTGRLLADTIRRSIEEVKIKGFGTGDKEQVSHKLHQFTKDLYSQYVKHSMLGGSQITDSWAVDPGIYGKERITIKDYQDGYYNFIGGSENSPNLPIDMSWVSVNDKIKSSAPAYSGDSNSTIDASGPINFFNLYNKYMPEDDQTFGNKGYQGN
tara:strand:- start:2893 stop:5412 length:2520 start_codon:yes stop_codon:yes gene_type:complete